jgi:ubiquitin-activating enzyme E1
VQATANIFAHIFGLKPETHAAKIAKIADGVIVPEFQPRKVVIKTDEAEQPAAEAPKEEEDEEAVQRLEEELLKKELNRSGTWHLIEFEKDDPTNFHIEQVGSVSNLRARNYKIEEVDNFKVKLIAGKIIPAIATTTAMVVGAVGIEITKNILKLKNEMYKNSFMNLALPLWVFSDPLPPIEHEDKAYDEILLGPVKAIPSSNLLI